MPKISARPSTPTLRVAFDERLTVNTKYLHAQLERLLGVVGCTACGLVGFDLDLRVSPIVNPGVDKFVATFDGIIEQ